MNSDATLRRLLIIGILAAVLPIANASARDAAFIDPGASAAGADDSAVKVEPKADIDAGETVLNVAKRLTVFFVNQTNQPIKVESVTLNADGNVTAEVTNDDCSKQGTITPSSRCTAEVSVTPTSPGPWGVDVLLTHNAAGRIARAKITGKTTGATGAAEKKDTGLALSTKEVNPVNFGDVESGTGKAVRSALMVNDSPEPITLYSIDVIEAENGLSRLDQGCAVDMELKPGESCPVTMVWQPTERGQISTDLIIRHSGKLGFAVIPIRGNAKGTATGTATASGKDSKDSTKITVEQKGDKGLPPPPSAQDLAKAISAAPVAASSLNTGIISAASSTSSLSVLRLIGTVGNRGVFLTADGNTSVSGVGDEFDSDGKKVKVMNITAKSADITVDGKKKTLQLGAAPELTSKASSTKSASATTDPLGGGSPSATQLPGGSSAVSGTISSATTTAAPVSSTPLLTPGAPAPSTGSPSGTISGGGLPR